MFRSLLSATVALATFIPALQAEQPVWFFDHFTDGSVRDNAPVSWSSHGYGDAMAVTSGDLILAPQSELAAAIVEAAGYQNVSLLTRVGVSTPGFATAGLVARQDGAVAYAAGISGNRLGRYDHSLILTYGPLSKGNFEILAAAPTSLDPSKTDVLLQFEVVDDALRLFAWADGTPRPAVPQLAVHDGRIRQGSVGISFDNDSSSAKATFREFLAMPQGSDTSLVSRLTERPMPGHPVNVNSAIPEPSTVTTLFVGLALASSRRTKSRSTFGWIAHRQRRNQSVAGAPSRSSTIK